jgi:plasmid replication initiation protein
MGKTYEELLDQAHKREERYQTLLEVEKNLHRKEITLNTDNYVVMANNMILHSASNLSLNELKLLRFVIMQTEKDEKELFTYTIPAKDLAKMLEIKQKDFYKKLKTMAKHLMQEVIYIGDDSKKEWVMFHWVDVCRYKKGNVTIKLSDELKPFLIELRGNFARYRLSEIISLKSIYAIRIYEILNGYLNENNLPYADNAVEISVSVEELRKATDTVKKFERPYDFKKKVVDVAIREINDKSKYHVTATPYKSGKAIVGFDFLIESQAGYWHRTTPQEPEEEIPGQMDLSDFIPYDKSRK